MTKKQRTIKRKKREFEDHPALGRVCAICNEVFEEEEIELSRTKSKAGIANGPVRIDGIPGFAHIKCRGRYTVNTIQNAARYQDLTGMANNIIGGR